MLHPGRFRPTCAAAATTAGDTHVPLSDLSAVGARIDAVQKFLHEKVNNNTVISSDQMQMVSTEISSAIDNIIICGTALIACSQPRNPSFSQLSFSDEKKVIDLKLEVKEEEINGHWEIIELDAVELLAEHIHFCEICGKGFKRDANLRMHMRAHGDRFKTHEALIKPENFSKSPHQTRFSCPFSGCNRNKNHNKFRPLKSVICVKNHFKRSHCPKMYSCNRCHKKNFAVLTDLKSHLKHCGDSKWKCSCGTSFSRKDKLFGHMALFEGHMPAVIDEDDDKGKIVISVADDNKESGQFVDDGPDENGFFDEFGSIEEFGIQDFLDSPNGPPNWIL